MVALGQGLVLSGRQISIGVQQDQQQVAVDNKQVVEKLVMVQHTYVVAADRPWGCMELDFGSWVVAPLEAQDPRVLYMAVEGLFMSNELVTRVTHRQYRPLGHGSLAEVQAETGRPELAVHLGRSILVGCIALVLQTAQELDQEHIVQQPAASWY